MNEFSLVYYSQNSVKVALTQSNQNSLSRAKVIIYFITTLLYQLAIKLCNIGIEVNEELLSGGLLGQPLDGGLCAERENTEEVNIMH